MHLKHLTFVRLQCLLCYFLHFRYREVPVSRVFNSSYHRYHFLIVHRIRTFLPTMFLLLRCHRQRRKVNHFVLLLPDENNPKLTRSHCGNVLFHPGEDGEGDLIRCKATEMANRHLYHAETHSRHGSTLWPGLNRHKEITTPQKP